MLPTRDLEYDLPSRCIATTPAEPRDAARLLVVRRTGNAPAIDLHVRDLPGLLRAGDLLVLNTTRVLPARLEGTRVDSGGHVEGLFLAQAGADWIVMLRARRPHAGVVVRLHAPDGTDGGVDLELVERVEHEPGAWRVRVIDRAASGTADPGARTPDVLARVGRTPLPPYILRARAQAGQTVDDAYDRARYQTLFAGDAGASVAAPTAGLHLTPGVLDALRAGGVGVAEVVLHVGTGTFRSVETEFVEQHPMHAEACFLSEATAAAIERTRVSGGRVVCVGTTAARTVEAYARGDAAPGRWHESRLLITPGYAWRWTDGLLTNFHLPRSTLLAMVASLVEGGVGRLLAHYGRAIEEGYRFYSYGDAMLVLPE
ncbi:MAG: tRNA preQ1(34) S-adenosylmethionine ribosyltransferase-isomerase QueA [Planctomycetota bacterium]|nr:tRNA preQ1(34) S-adenosylmethionine ribosyltransferase-isomerase QueA [Planctomycetota bacterium]